MKYQRTILASTLFTLSVSGCRGPEGPTGTGGTESLIDPRVQPHVIYTNPPANSQGPYADFTSQLSVRFNKIMDRSSIRRSLSLAAPHGDIATDSNSVRTTGGDVFTFNAFDSLLTRSYAGRWRIGETYTLNISSEARDVNGNYLQPSYVMTFAPEPFFRVRTTIPADGATDFGVGSSIVLQFNAPVDSGFASSIHIDPPSTGYWRFDYYTDSSRLTYDLISSLELDTVYTVTIDTTAHDREGNHLSAQFQSTFRTIPFLVVYSYPSNGYMVDRTTVIEIDTDAPYDSMSVPGSFSITPVTSGKLAYIPGGSHFTFTASDSLQPRTQYTVELSTALRSSSGKHLKSPYTFSFTTFN